MNIHVHVFYINQTKRYIGQFAPKGINEIYIMRECKQFYIFTYIFNHNNSVIKISFFDNSDVHCLIWVIYVPCLFFLQVDLSSDTNVNLLYTYTVHVYVRFTCTISYVIIDSLLFINSRIFY